MSDTPLDKKVAVVFAGALAFGLYCSTFLTCLRWLLCVDEGWKLRKNIRWPVVVAAGFIFVFNVLYLAWNLHWNMARVWHAVHDPPSTPRFQTPDSASIISCTLANATVLLADIVLIIRCWIVYGKRNRTILIVPIFLWLVGFLCTVLQIYLQVAHMHNSHIGPYNWASVNMSWGPGIVLMPFWISTILLNAYVSFVLIRRVLRAVKQSPPTSIEYFHSVIHVIAESGVLYFPVTLAHLLVWFGSSKFAIDVISVLNAPLIGMAFNWLIIRASRNKAAAAAKKQEKNFGQTSAVKFGRSTTGTYQNSSFFDVEARRTSESDTAETLAGVIIIR